MKGLLIKDIYVIYRQLKFFLMIIAVYACIPSMPLRWLSMLFASIIPVYLLSYDEKWKWDKIASMMPYSAREIVLSKYLIGYAMTALATLLSLLAGVVWASDDTGIIQTVEYIICMASSGLIIMAIQFPIMMKVGVEKGRFIYIALVVLGCVFIGINDSIIGGLGIRQVEMMSMTLFVVAVSIIINILSALISVYMYQKRRA